MGRSPKRKDLEVLIRRLNSLQEGEEAAKELIAQGAPAIEPLRRFLLEGAPGVTFQPRQWAAQALAALGAKDVLMEYLKSDREISDPATRYAEEAVQITAARALKAWPTEDVVKLLLELAAARPQVGVIDALGAARRPEAIPYFIRALEDDVCRGAAEEALYQLGATAREALISAAITRVPPEQPESPSSLRRRRSALTLMRKMLLPRHSWQRLRPCLDDSDPAVVAAAAALSVRLGNSADRFSAARRLIAVLPSADSFLEQEIEKCLLGLVKDARPALLKEINRRLPAMDPAKGPDKVLDLLLRIARVSGGKGEAKK